jgi:hypothetical protein
MDYGVRYWMSAQLMGAIAYLGKPFDGGCLCRCDSLALRLMARCIPPSAPALPLPRVSEPKR